MNTGIISFNSRVNIAYEQVTENYQGAVLLSVTGTSKNKSTEVSSLTVIFSWQDTKTIIIEETNPGEFGEPAVFDTAYGGVVPIDWPIGMDLKEAIELLQAAGYSEPFLDAGLIHPALPDFEHPQFLFRLQEEYVTVDILTKKVRELNTAEVQPNDQNFGIVYELKCKVDKRVRTPATLILEKSNLKWGDFGTKPPRQIHLKDFEKPTILFAAFGIYFWPGGTEGEVWYKTSDASGTLFKIRWNIPATAGTKNKGSFTGGSKDFKLHGGAVHPKDWHQRVLLEIEQVGPIS